jgi:hypothetical protein
MNQDEYQVVYRVTDQDLSYLMDSVFGGGVSQEWVLTIVRDPGSPPWEGELFVRERPKQVQARLTREMLVNGLRVCATKYPKRFAEWQTGVWDAITADVILQCGLFGEIVYQ